MENSKDILLINVLLEKTLEQASTYSVSLDKIRSCYEFNFHGFELELPVNWSGFIQKFDTVFFDSTSLLVLSKHLGKEFREVGITRNDAAHLFLVVFEDERLSSSKLDVA